MATPGASSGAAPRASSRSATSTPVSFRPLAPPSQPAQGSGLSPTNANEGPPIPPQSAQQQQQSIDAALPQPQIFDVLPALHELLSRLLASPPPSAVLETNGDASVAEPQSQTQAQIQSQTQTEEHAHSDSQAQSQPQAPETQTQPQLLTESQPETQPQPQADESSSASIPTAGAGAAAAAQPPPPPPPEIAPGTGQYATHQPTYPNQTPLSVQHLMAEVSTIRNMIRRAREAVSALPDVERTINEQEEEIEYLQGEAERLRKVLVALAGEMHTST